MFRGFWKEKDGREIRSAELKCRVIKTREQDGELVIEIPGGPDRRKRTIPERRFQPFSAIPRASGTRG